MRSLTLEHVSPWTAQVVLLSMRDGTQRIGLLGMVDRNSVRLHPVGGRTDAVPGERVISLADVVGIRRAPRVVS